MLNIGLATGVAAGKTVGTTALLNTIKNIIGDTALLIHIITAMLIHIIMYVLKNWRNYGRGMAAQGRTWAVYTIIIGGVKPSRDGLLGLRPIMPAKEGALLPMPSTPCWVYIYTTPKLTIIPIMRPMVIIVSLVVPAIIFTLLITIA